MRIAMVSEHASPLAPTGGVDAGGQNVHVAALSAALVRAGHRVTVFTRRDRPDLPARVTTRDGYVVEHIDAGPPCHIPKDDLLPLMPQFGALMGQRLIETPHDLVHAHFWMSGIASLTSRSLAGHPVLLTFHALGSVKRRHQGAMDSSPSARVECEAELCQAVDHIIATCSDEVFELRRMGMVSDRVSVVPCGVDHRAFSPDGIVAPGPTSRHRALAVGRLVPRKGMDDAIRALAEVPDAELVIAGGPPRHELHRDAEAARLRLVAQQYGVGDRVTLLGAVSRSSMPALMRSSDALLATPWYEPFGMVALEGMACGVPVIASMVGGLADTIVDGVTGLHVPPRDPSAIAAAMRKVFDNPHLARELGSAGIARARQRYTWDAVARLTLQSYQRVANRRSVSSRTGVAQ